MEIRHADLLLCKVQDSEKLRREDGTHIDRRLVKQTQALEYVHHYDIHASIALEALSVQSCLPPLDVKSHCRYVNPDAVDQQMPRLGRTD